MSKTLEVYQSLAKVSAEGIFINRFDYVVFEDEKARKVFLEGYFKNHFKRVYGPPEKLASLPIKKISLGPKKKRNLFKKQEEDK